MFPPAPPRPEVRGTTAFSIKSTPGPTAGSRSCSSPIAKRFTISPSACSPSSSPYKKSPPSKNKGFVSKVFGNPKGRITLRPLGFSSFSNRGRNPGVKPRDLKRATRRRPLPFDPGLSQVHDTQGFIFVIRRTKEVDAGRPPSPTRSPREVPTALSRCVPEGRLLS